MIENSNGFSSEDFAPEKRSVGMRMANDSPIQENNNNMSERGLNRNSSTGHKRISKDEKGYRYVNQIKKHSKRFKTLQDAIEYKNEYESKSECVLRT